MNKAKKISLALIFLLIFHSTAYAKSWKGIVVHHSATKTGTVESFRRHHVNVNGWQDIGYNFVIYRNGSIHKGRSLEINGAHARGRNATHIGICLVGEDVFTADQVVALYELCRDLAEDYQIQSIERHHKDCPGIGVKVELLEYNILN